MPGNVTHTKYVTFIFLKNIFVTKKFLKTTKIYRLLCKFLQFYEKKRKTETFPFSVHNHILNLVVRRTVLGRFFLFFYI